MESVKKLLPFILVAIVFAVGGYFIGKGALNDQGAALYRTDSLKTAGLDKTGSTNKPPAVKVEVEVGDDGVCAVTYTYSWMGFSYSYTDIGRWDGKGCNTISIIPPDTKPIMKGGKRVYEFQRSNLVMTTQLAK